MIIAIPSVTTYISNSRKSAYIDTAKNIVGGARNLVNEGKLEMYDPTVTYYIPISCIKTETGLKTPYGEFEEDGAYVGVTFDGNGYNYYWISNDTSGQGVNEVTPLNDLNEEKIVSGIKSGEVKDIIRETGLDGRNSILIYNSDCTGTTHGKETMYVYAWHGQITNGASLSSIGTYYNTYQEAFDAGYSIVLRHLIENDIIVSSDVMFTFDENQHILIGSDPDSYQTNESMLLGFTDQCAIMPNMILCAPGSCEMRSWKNGSVSAIDWSRHGCYANYHNVSYCT